jgi:hypothetical protein
MLLSHVNSYTPAQMPASASVCNDSPNKVSSPASLEEEEDEYEEEDEAAEEGIAPRLRDNATFRDCG